MLTPMQELLDVMRRLRGPGGCPWDQEQTHESLRPYLIEEAAEAADAVGGPSEELAGELGDVLLQIAFHSVLGEEAGTFSYTDVERSIVAKMVRRHPHVFGDLKVGGAAEVVSNWQAIKAAERGGRVRGAAEQVPSGLGALAREKAAQKLAGQPTMGRAEAAAALAQATEDEAGVAQALGAVVAWARSLGVDPETALRSQVAGTLARLDSSNGLKTGSARD